MDNMLLIFVVVGFFAVVLLMEGSYLLWSSYRGAEAKRIQRRLQALSAGGHFSGQSEFLKNRMRGNTPFVERFFLSLPRMGEMDRLLMQSGLELSMSKFLGMTAVAALAGLIVWLVLPVPLWTVAIFVVVAASIPLFYVLQMRRKRLEGIDQQLPDALELQLVGIGGGGLDRLGGGAG